MREHKILRAQSFVKIPYRDSNWNKLTVRRGDFVIYRRTYSNGEQEPQIQFGRVIAIVVPHEPIGVEPERYVEVAMLSNTGLSVYLGVNWIDPKDIMYALDPSENMEKLMGFFFSKKEWFSYSPEVLEKWLESGYATPEAMESKTIYPKWEE